MNNFQISLSLSSLESVLFCIYCAILFVGGLYVLPSKGLHRNERSRVLNRIFAVLISTFCCSITLYYFFNEKV